MLGEVFANASYIDVALLLLIVFVLFSGIKVQRRVEQRIEEMEKKILALKKYQGDAFQSLDNRYVSLKKTFFDKTNELITKLQAILKSNKAVMSEIDNKTRPLRASLDDTMDKVKATKDSLRKTILENEKEIKDIRKELNDFSKEIQRMKDDIRERTIDLEL
jgi:methyl-accepting chemotaxis protein